MVIVIEPSVSVFCEVSQMSLWDLSVVAEYHVDWNGLDPESCRVDKSVGR